MDLGAERENRPKTLFFVGNATTIKFWTCTFYCREVLLSLRRLLIPWRFEIVAIAILWFGHLRSRDSRATQIGATGLRGSEREICLREGLSDLWKPSQKPLKTSENLWKTLKTLKTSEKKKNSENLPLRDPLRDPLGGRFPSQRLLVLLPLSCYRINSSATRDSREPPRLWKTKESPTTFLEGPEKFRVFTILFKSLHAWNCYFRIIFGLQLQLSGVFGINEHYSYSFLVFLAEMELQEIIPLGNSQEFTAITVTWLNGSQIKSAMISKRMVEILEIPSSETTPSCAMTPFSGLDVGERLGGSRNRGNKQAWEVLRGSGVSERVSERTPGNLWEDPLYWRIRD